MIIAEEEFWRTVHVGSSRLRIVPGALVFYVSHTQFISAWTREFHVDLGVVISTHNGTQVMFLDNEISYIPSSLLHVLK